MAAVFVALCLTSCSVSPTKPSLSDPQIVRVPGATRYIPVPAELTEPTPEPDVPVPLCADSDGLAVLCVTQMAFWLLAWQSAFASSEADKTAIRQLAPEPAPPGDTP